MNFLRSFYHQMLARKNLCRLRDARAFFPILGSSLIRGAMFWPTVLPWKPKIIVEVGSYDGETAKELSELYRPEVMVLVEPLPEMTSLLHRRTFAPEQRIFACALGQRNGEEIMNLLAHRPSSSLLEPADSGSRFGVSWKKTDQVTVPVRALDSVVEECALERLDLLKVDVQGNEMEVFLGGIETLKMTRMIVTEVSFTELYKGQPLFKDVYSFLSDSGFELNGTFGYGRDKRGIPLQCDALFVNRFILQ